MFVFYWHTYGIVISKRRLTIMDKQIEPKHRKTKKMILLGIPIVLLLSILLMNLTRKKEISLQKDEISIREVTEGDFEDVVLFNSTVEPKTSVLVNVIQGGAIAEVFVESGQMIKKGTPILRVENPDAALNYLTQETAIIEQINNLRNIRVSIKNQQLNLDQQLLSIQNDFKNAERQYKLDTTLYSKGVVAKNNFLKTSQEFKFQKERSSVIKKSVYEEKKSRNVQLSRINASIANMEKSLNMLRKNKENFIVKAPVNGLLSSFNPILGKNYNQGQSVGKIDVLNGFKLVAQVDEYYITKLKKEGSGTVSINDIPVEIEVTKIHSEIVNGRFTVELKFKKDTLNNNIRRGMSLKSKLYLSNNSKAILISKGQFYQNTHGKWVFVLTKNNKAEKRKITIGRENPFYYEVIEGLEPGEKIIASNYDGFENVEKVNIK